MNPQSSALFTDDAALWETAKSREITKVADNKITRKYGVWICKQKRSWVNSDLMKTGLIAYGKQWTWKRNC